MQTIKTAAVVVLLLTVMYGGYTSLTTPPEPVPPEYAGLLEIEDSLGIDTGMSETLAGAQAPAIDFPRTNGNTLQNAASQFGNAFNQNATTQLQSPTLNGPNSLQGHTVSSGSPKPFPSVSTPIQNASVDLGKDYPMTQGTFQMPKPSGTSGFDSNIGNAFVNKAAEVAEATKNISLPTMDSLPSMDSLDSAVTNLAPAALNTATNALANNLPSLGAPTNNLPSLGAPTSNLGLENAFKTADRQYSNDQLSEALATLSVFYSDPNIAPAQRQKLLSRLDPLAKSVIYSDRHLIQQPHRVGTNETLMEVAAKYKVPWQLLANINGIKDPLVVMPGTELKVIQGPFSAEIDLSSQELTVFAGDLYAGRFPVAIGASPSPAPGTFTILDKQSKRTYYDQSGIAFPPESPQNPYGSAWMDLGNQLCIHGSPAPQQATNKGCISLAGNHAKDLFGILSLGSSVTIRR